MVRTDRQHAAEPAVSAPRANPPGTAGRVLGWFSGALTVTIVLLALVMIGAVVLARLDGQPGPMSGAVVAHALAALICVVLQRFADRYRGWARVVCSWTVVVLVAVMFVLYWW